MTWTCRRCKCVFAVGLSMCPQCTGTDVFETGSEAPVDIETGEIGAPPEAEPLDGGAVSELTDEKPAKATKAKT